MALNNKLKTFIIHIGFLGLRSKMIIQVAQKDKIVLLLVKKFFSPAKYFYFANNFSKKLVKMLLERNAINKHIIELIDNKLSSYPYIYS